MRRALICLSVSLCALALPAGAGASYSHGTREQVAWVRSAATRFVSAELSRDGAGACAVLAAPLRVGRHGRSCAQRWDAKLHALLEQPESSRSLRRLQRAIPSAPVDVQGDLAWIRLPAALMDGPNRFRWTENCWMLEA